MDSPSSPTLTNADPRVILSFSEEWRYFQEDRITEQEKIQIFWDYFHLFPWEKLPKNAVGADIGCGSGRWAGLVAPKVDSLFCIDVSHTTLDVARSNLSQHKNIKFVYGSAGALPLEDNSLDFAYTLGVLHHLPDPKSALKSITHKLKVGAPILIYLYYAFDNRPFWYRWVWKASDLIRKSVSILPFQFKFLLTGFFTYTIYWPLARMGLLLDKLGILPSAWPLSYYRDKNTYTMRIDALDRFGTPLERRFSRQEIHQLLVDSGLENIRFSERAPYWVVIATRKAGHEGKPTPYPVDSALQ